MSYDQLAAAVDRLGASNGELTEQSLLTQQTADAARVIAEDKAAIATSASNAANASKVSSAESAAAALVSKNSAAASASTATQKAGEAVTSATAALASQTAAKTSETNAKASEVAAAPAIAAGLRFCGVSATAPTTRTNGTALQRADEYQNTVDNLRYSWAGSAWVALNSSAQQLEVSLADAINLANGAGKVGRVTRQIHSVNELITAPGRYHGDQVSLTSYYGGWAAMVGGVPTGAGRLIWDETSTATEDGGKVFAVTGLTQGRWKRPGKHYYDDEFGVVTSNDDQTEAWQRLFSSLQTGKKLVVTCRSRSRPLSTNVNSVKATTDSAAYLDTPALMLHAATTIPLLSVGGFGWKFSEWVMEDATVTAGAVNMGSVALLLKRSNGARDVDATFNGCVFSRFDMAVNVVGINTQFSQGCIFSLCLRPIVVDQVGSEIVRGIRVRGARFHGRPDGLIDACITINGTSQAEAEISGCVADGIGVFYKGHLSRRTQIYGNSVATPAGDAFIFTGGTGGTLGINSVGGGSRSAVVMDGCASPTINGLKIDSMGMHGIHMTRVTDWVIRGLDCTNVGMNYLVDGDIYDGVYIDPTCAYGTIHAPKIRQLGAQSGRYGINNLGSQTRFEGSPDIENFKVGSVFNDPTRRVYGDTRSVHAAPRISSGTAAPTTGTYGAADIHINTNVNQANPISRWICTIAGSPGVWRPDKWVVFIGPTTGRPTLRAEDVGVQYMDTTLEAVGKAIWWRGSSWVDATPGNSRVSNVKGWVTKLDDGTLIMRTVQVNTPSLAANTFSLVTIPLPLDVSFATEQLTIQGSISAGASNDHFGVTAAYLSASGEVTLVVRNGAQAQTFNAHATIWGRWK